MNPVWLTSAIFVYFDAASHQSIVPFGTPQVIGFNRRYRHALSMIPGEDGRLSGARKITNTAVEKAKLLEIIVLYF